MNGPLRILQVSAADIRGGAEQIALQLHRAYRNRGHDAWLLVGERCGDPEPGVIAIDNESSLNSWARWWRSLGQQAGSIKGLGRLKTLCSAIAEPKRTLRIYQGHEDMDHPGSRRLLEQIPSRPDIIHLHNLHSTHPYFDLRVLPALSHSIPTFITLHDAWLTTGHCAHSFACERWQTGCGQCPDLTIYPAIRRDATAQNWLAKRDIFAASKLHVITPSYWLMQRVEQSMLWPALRDGRVIPNGVDREIFSPLTKTEARAQLNLPADQPVLLAMTGGKGNQFKDRKTLLAAIEHLTTLIERPFTVVLLGEEPERGTRQNATFQSLPSLSPQKVAQYLSAADIMLHAAHVDTFPNSILEAMACGTPVVATAVGGIPEQIRTDSAPTGRLVPPADPLAIAHAVRELLVDEPLRQTMSGNALAAVNERFTLAAQVEAVEAYYRTAITS